MSAARRPLRRCAWLLVGLWLAVAACAASAADDFLPVDEAFAPTASRADDEGGRAAGRLAGGRDASGGADALGAKAGEAGKLRGAGSGRAASVKRKFAAQLAAFGAATSVQSPLSTGFVTRKPGARAR